MLSKKTFRFSLVPYMDLLEQIGKALKIEKISTLSKMINVLTIGVSFALLKYDKKLVENAIKATFHDKIAQMNVTAVDYAYDYAEKNFQFNQFEMQTRENRLLTRKEFSSQETRLLQWAKFWAAAEYKHTILSLQPQTRANTSKSHELLKTRKGNEAVVVIQTEDEIAAINSASGACLTGAEQRQAHSGPGFDLMAEGLSWAGNNEVPVVVTLYQRGGPSTGRPQGIVNKTCGCSA